MIALLNRFFHHFYRDLKKLYHYNFLLLSCSFILFFTSVAFSVDTKESNIYVLKKQTRKEGLSGVSALLSFENEAFKKRIAEGQDPFSFDRKKDTSDPTVAFSEGEEYDDYQILEYALFKLKPSGTVIKDGKHGKESVLVFPNGDTLRQGDIFRIRIKSNIYPIQLSKVTAKSYTFKRYSAEIEENFEESASADVPKQ